MASHLTHVLLICLLAAPFVASQTSTTPDELGNGADQANNQQQPQGPFTSPISPTSQQQEQNEIPNQTEQQEQATFTSTMLPKGQKQAESSDEDQTSMEDPSQQNHQQQSNNPFMRPFMRPFFSLFNGGNLFDTIRQHRQSMDKQFEQLRQQASEGQEESYFSRNGVSYVRTCTTKRV